MELMNNMISAPLPSPYQFSVFIFLCFEFCLYTLLGVLDELMHPYLIVL